MTLREKFLSAVTGTVDLFPDLTEKEKRENQVAAEIELKAIRNRIIKERAKDVYRTMG